MALVASDEAKTAGWPIPAKVKEDFTDFCKEVGSLAKDDCAGALFAWRFLPAQIREWAKLSTKGQVEPQIEFWFALRDYLNRVIKESLSVFLVEAPASLPLAPASGTAERGLELIRELAATMSEESIRLLSPEEQRLVDQIRRELGPEPMSEAQAAEARRRANEQLAAELLPDLRSERAGRPASRRPRGRKAI